MALTQDQLDALKPFLENLRLASDRIRTWSDLENSQRRESRDSHNEFLNWYKKHIKVETEERKKALDLLTKANEQHRRNRDIERDAISKLSVLRQARQKLEKEQIRLAKIGQNLTLDQQNQLKEVADEYTKQRARLKEAFAANKDIKNQMKLTQDTLKMVSWKDYAAGVKEHAKSLFESKATIAAFGSAVKQVYTDIRGMVQASGGFVEGTGLMSGYVNSLMDAFSTGASTEELNQMIAANRQAVLAFGGQSSFIDMFQEKIGDANSLLARYTVLTGSAANGAKALSNQMTMMYKAGIKPSQIEMASFADGVANLSKRTGVSINDLTTKFAELYNNDADMQIMLRSATMEQRDAILKNTRATIEQSVAAGMSAEQAFEVAKMLNKMTSAKPMDRIKAAARIRALGGALGISGANEAAQAVLSGSQTPEAKEAVRSFGERASNLAAESRLSGNLPQELFVTSLLDKLDLEKFFGDGSPFVNKLADAMKPSESAVTNLTDLSSTWWADLFLRLDQFQSLISGPILAALTVGFALLAKTIMGKAALSMAGGALGGLGKAAGALASVPVAAITGAILGTAATGQALADISKGGRGDNFINDFFESVMGFKEGESLGTKIYDWMHDDGSKKPAGGTATSSSRVSAPSAALPTPQISLADQVTKLDKSNGYLAGIKETVDKQLEIAEKQLAATLVSKEDRAAAYRDLGRGNRFMASYNTIS